MEIIARFPEKAEQTFRDEVNHLILLKPRFSIEKPKFDIEKPTQADATWVFVYWWVFVYRVMTGTEASLFEGGVTAKP